MREFERLMQPLTPEWVESILQQRLLLAKQGPGNILTPGNLPPRLQHAPFNFSDYPHKDKVQYLGSKEWIDVLKIPPESLMSANPFEPSAIRPGGFKIWDAAIGIPASSSRNIEPMRMTEIKPIRNCNTHWNGPAKVALSRVGPLGPNGAMLRPVDRWLVDLKEIPEGWNLLNMAHGLAHLRGDESLTHDSAFIYRKPDLHFRVPSSLAEIVMAMLFGLPLDIGPRQEGKPGRPDFPCYFIEMKSSAYFPDGFCHIPQVSNEALRVDETIAVVSASVFIEPPPGGFATGSTNKSDDDRWCCMPTIVMITGWELVDVITHLPLMSVNPKDVKKDVCYGLLPEDMMPPESFLAYLHKAKEIYGDPMEATEKWARREGHPEWIENFMYVEDFLSSKKFSDLYMNTPPLVCEQCMNWNTRSEGTPIKPWGRKPKYSRIKDRPEWVEHGLKIKEALKKYILPAIEKYEGKLMGKRLAKKLMRQRRKNHRLIWDKRLDRYHLAKLEEKIREKGSLTAREEIKYNSLLDTVKSRTTKG